MKYLLTGYRVGNIQGTKGQVELTPLEVAQIVADRLGYDYVDCEPTGIGTRWKIRLHQGKTQTAYGGDSLDDACNEFILANYGKVFGD